MAKFRSSDPLALLEGWRNRPEAEQSYGPGNVVNLLRLQRGDLRGLNLAHLALPQAYLAEAAGAGHVARPQGPGEWRSPFSGWPAACQWQRGWHGAAVGYAKWAAAVDFARAHRRGLECDALGGWPPGCQWQPGWDRAAVGCRRWGSAGRAAGPPRRRPWRDALGRWPFVGQWQPGM